MGQCKSIYELSVWDIVLDISDRVKQSFRARLFFILSGNDTRGNLGKVFDVFLIIIISANVLAVVLESVQEFENTFATAFHIFEVLSVAIFSVEYLCRLWVAVESHDYDGDGALMARLKYCITPMAMIDLLSVLPFYLSFLVGIDLRFLRVLRLARIFKLTRYSSAMTTLVKVFRKEAQVFGAALFVLFILMVFSSSMIYLFEHEAQPEAFSDIPKAMWWAVITLTTVGYGDVYPITAMGKLFGSVISVIGIGMVALPAGILASGFSEQLHQSRTEYQHRVHDALEDGILTDREASRLNDLREELGLSPQEAAIVFRNAVRGATVQEITCPHCGELINAEIVELDDATS